MFVSAAGSIETPAEPGGGGLAKSPVRAMTRGRNFSQLSSSAKRAASSFEGLWRSRSRRSSSRLQASSNVLDVASIAGDGEAGGSAPPADIVSGAAPFGLDTLPDPAAWLRLSKIASSCGHILGHLSSLPKRKASSNEGFA
jgi:hypothetical protein